MKSLFKFTTGQRYGIFLLVALVIILQCVYFIVDFPTKPYQDNHALINEFQKEKLVKAYVSDTYGENESYVKIIMDMIKNKLITSSNIEYLIEVLEKNNDINDIIMGNFLNKVIRGLQLDLKLYWILKLNYSWVQKI